MENMKESEKTIWSIVTIENCIKIHNIDKVWSGFMWNNDYRWNLKDICHKYKMYVNSLE